jgi:hypothetical protein
MSRECSIEEYRTIILPGLEQDLADTVYQLNAVGPNSPYAAELMMKIQLKELGILQVKLRIKQIQNDTPEIRQQIEITAAQVKQLSDKIIKGEY